MSKQFIKQTAERNCSCGNNGSITITGGDNCNYCGNEIVLCEVCWVEFNRDMTRFTLKRFNDYLSNQIKENQMFQPIFDRVLIRPDEVREVTASGLIIPDIAKEVPTMGTAVAVGPGKVDNQGNLIPTKVKVGDRVMFGKFAGTQIKLNGETFEFMREADIMGIVVK